ncbi:HypC/HybG/HupF family hydrogenase formation chaperone [Syntrophomonas wolfei]|jgi:hydrogenase expression/formation protein HypC|uniref:HypC/HybG/HupF family hydrogenase formation chaperone n=1 Tax=Syntrophomonas wolfei TaxID=863 RepID=UPI00077476E8|nr:HypC/HybG/HupF family hydrogenase formation chaperone [Syntrophomonas wolfei]
MCLGVPGKILEIKEHDVAQVDVDGNQLDISIRLTPEVQKGQFVLVHAGFAMEIIDESRAVETMDLLKELQKYRELGI